MDRKLLFYFFIFLNLSKADAQLKSGLSPNTLTQRNEEYLIEEFYKNELDSIKAYPYAQAYLLKSKKQNDSVKIANGFYFLSIISTSGTRLALNDSIIKYTKRNTTKLYPTIAYIDKANYYYKTRNFHLSLQNYLEAKKYIKFRKNTDLEYYIKNRIALLKSRYGEEDEALKLFKEVYNHYDKRGYLKKSDAHYFPIVFALSDSYLRNEKLDSAAFFVDKGYRESKGNPLYRNYFIFQQGIIEHKQNNYLASIDSIKKSLPSIIKNEDYPNIAYANFYIGKSYLNLEAPQKSVDYFKEVDTIFQASNDIHPDLRSAYVHLIDYYKTKGDKDNQLVYITRLLEVDSTLHENYKTINRKFKEEYDTPKAVAAKNQLIHELKDNISNFSIWLGTLLFFLLIIIIITIVLYFKRKKDIIRFKKLLEHSAAEKHKNSEKSIPVITQKKVTGLSSDLTEPILESLREFEDKNGFLKKKLKVFDLAKQFNTNSKYLSMVINEHKNKNFSQYLNDLRIEYVISRLQEDEKFRRYSIKAISEEIGFSNTESFSKAFYKKTEIYPSFFIKQLDKKKN